MIPTCFHVPLLEVPRVCMAAYIRTRSIDTWGHVQWPLPIVWYSMQDTPYHHTIYAQLHVTSTLFFLLTFLRSVAIMTWASLDVGFLGEGLLKFSPHSFTSSPFFSLPLIGTAHLIKPLIGEHKYEFNDLTFHWDILGNVTCRTDVAYFDKPVTD